MNDETDLDLLTAIAKKDEQAMERFYNQYSGLVYQFAFKTLQNGPDAAEVMNEVMLEVWRKAASFKGSSKVKTWLLSVTHNKAVDAVRRNARHDGTEELDADAHTAPQCQLDDAVATAQHAKFVQHCLQKLKLIHRQVVYLTFFEGLPYPEIAKVLNVPNGTVKTRMLHGKKLLQNCLAGLSLQGSDSREDWSSSSSVQQPTET
ncbi:MAG: sigma-70 family RNA polymerase sigma factor [Cellvibrionaceae bacterium]